MTACSLWPTSSKISTEDLLLFIAIVVSFVVVAAAIIGFMIVGAYIILAHTNRPRVS